jgi:hypothetical protein
METRKLQRWSFPDISVDLEKVALFVGKTDLALFVEAGFLEVICKSIVVSVRCTSADGGHLLLVVHSRFQNDSLCPIIRKPAVMYQRTQPDLDSVCTPELLFAY